MKKVLPTSFTSLLILILLIPGVLAWELDRPRNYVEFIDERDQSSETDGDASVGLGVHIQNYHENEQGFPSYGYDYVKLWVAATANTREGLAYYVMDWQPCGLTEYEWHDVINLVPNWEGDYDDGFGCIPLEQPVRFYGGPKSAEYYSVWVSANGFISFEELSAPTPRYYSKTIPHVEEPNAFVAPLWRDLDLTLSGTITYGYVYHSPGYADHCLVISWNDIPNKNDGATQTFQVVIEMAQERIRGYRQSRIWFQYKQITSDDGTKVGIEEQHGLKGVSYNPLSLHNQFTAMFEQESNSYFIQYLTIKLNRQSDPYSLVYINRLEDSMRGYHVNLRYPEYQPDPLYRFAKAIGGTATLLISVLAPPVWIAAVGLMASTALVTLGWAEAFSSFFEPANPLQIEDDGTPSDPTPRPLSYAKVEAEDRYLQQGLSVVDATFGICVYWIFTDQNSQEHNLEITAELEYAEFAVGTPNIVAYKNISTSIPVNLKMDSDICNDFSNPKQVTAGEFRGCLDTVDYADMYVIKNVNYGQVIEVEMTSPSDANYDLYLYNPNQIQKKNSSNSGNATESISYPTDSAGDWYIKVKLTFWEGHKNAGIYRLVVNAPYPAPKLTVLTKTTGGSSISYVDIRVDSTWYYSPVNNLPLLPGTHTIITRGSFQRGDYLYTFQYWENGHTSNTRTLNIQSDKTITAYYSVEYVPPPPPPPGGGCPYVYTWNGTTYVLDNNILGASEVSNGTDVEDYYRLEQTPVPTFQGAWFSRYSLQISEFEHEHSYIDKVRLYAVDHDANVNVAVTPNGQILTYANPNPPISAIDNYGYDWLPFVSAPDNFYYRGFPGDYLLLDFGSIDVSQAAKLVLRANVELKKDECIHVQVLNATSEWTDAAVLRTRNHWSTIILDLADYLPNPDGTLKMRLYFTGIHKIDYIGLDTTPQADITVIQTAAFSAVHSTQGDVTLKLLLNDQKYAELVPNEQITLKFILPNTQKTRTFITYTEGHYYKIE